MESKIKIREGGGGGGAAGKWKLYFIWIFTQMISPGYFVFNNISCSLPKIKIKVKNSIEVGCEIKEHFCQNKKNLLFICIVVI